MTRDDHSLYSSNCKQIDMSNSHLDEGGSTRSPTLAELMRLQESRRAKPLKAMIRSANWGIGHPIRKNLWKSCLEMQENLIPLYTEEDYWLSVENVFGSRDINHLDSIDTSKKSIESSFNEYLFYTYHLDDKGINACCRIVPAFMELRDQVINCPMLFAITALLLHFMEEVDAFKCLDRMVSSNIKYFPKTKAARNAVSNGLTTLTKRHERSAYNKLSKLHVAGREEIFAEWDKWIFGQLPFPLLLRIMDCYFNEGMKIFYRTCMTCFNYCMKDVTENPTTGSALVTDGFAKAMSIFLPKIKKTPKQFLTKCFRIRKFSSKEIGRVLTESTDRSMDLELSMSNPTAGVDMFDDGVMPFNPEVEQTLARSSRTATIEQFQQLWRHLPMRVQLCSPTLIFTTEVNGTSIGTLYRLVDKYAPFLILIKDTNDYVFGAYCSHPLDERNAKDEYRMKQTFFGNGETFVFSIAPTFESHKWVGIRMQNEVPTLTSIDRAFQLFIHADSGQIMIGGGINDAAIQFDKNLERGKSSESPTFSSPILSKNTDYIIKVLEVYSITDM